MDGNLWVAVLGVVLATASLAWQAATYALTGGRVRVLLRVGAVDVAGNGMITAAPSSLRQDWLANLAEQGYPRPIVAVRVANIGRQPVTVASWCLKSPHGASLQDMAAIGPRLPCPLGVGESQTWAIDLETAVRFAQAAKETLGKRRRGLPDVPLREALRAGWHAGRGNEGLAGVVELADGRKRRSRDVLR